VPKPPVRLVSVGASFDALRREVGVPEAFSLDALAEARERGRDPIRGMLVAQALERVLPGEHQRCANQPARLGAHGEGDVECPRRFDRGGAGRLVGAACGECNGTGRKGGANPSR